MSPPNTTVADMSFITFKDDIERASGSTAILPVDPFQFRDGIVSEEQLTNLRRRKKGKRVAKYQCRQNDVFANASRS